MKMANAQQPASLVFLLIISAYGTLTKCNEDFDLVAAIDFGSTYSGYAFSTKEDFENDSRIRIKQELTCLLLNSDKKVIAFGYDAQYRYAEIVKDEEIDHLQFYYFQQYKMDLHKTEDLSQTTEIEDITGKKMMALEVFSLSIHALKEHLLQLLEEQIEGVAVDDISWVLTSPWTYDSKEFMRNSAEMAGIESDKLLIALESEAASVYCLNISLGRNEEGIGPEFVVVDIGELFVDVIALRIIDGNITEICRAARGNFGGASVYSAFFDMMEEITGKEVINYLRLKHTEEYLELIKEFEIKKGTITSKTTGNIIMAIPFTTLDSLCKEYLNKDFQTAIEASSFASFVSVQKDKLQISAETFRTLFQPTIQSTLDLMSDILQRENVYGLGQIFLFGGFSEYELVQTAVRKTFPQHKIIVPSDSGLAVLNGAVVFGHKPEILTERIAKCTYRIEKNDSEKHVVNHSNVTDG